MLKPLSLLVLILLLFAAAPLQARDEDAVPGEVLVKLLQSSDLAAIAATYHLDPTPLAQFGARPIFRLHIADGASPTDRAAALTADPRVLYAEPNFLNATPEGRSRVSWARGDPSDYTAQWAPQRLGLPAAQAVSRGAGVVVAVLDGGFDLAHPALAGHLLPGHDFVDDDGDPSEVGAVATNPAYGHGTHVAGLVALVAPDAKILPLRVLDAQGQGNVWVLAEALAYARDPDGDPSTSDGAGVINLSLSTLQRTRLLGDTIAEVCDSEAVIPGQGVVIVAAAGNSASTQPEYPAGERDHGLLAVAASTEADTLASFSNDGLWVQLAAPGEQIVSAVPGGYGAWSGTSMAAPLVAGAAALVRSARPTLGARTVAEHLIDRAAPIAGDLPRLDVAAALAALPPDLALLRLPLVVR